VIGDSYKLMHNAFCALVFSYFFFYALLLNTISVIFLTFSKVLPTHFWRLFCILSDHKNVF